MDIIFDLGNVLLNFNPKEYLDNLNLDPATGEKVFNNIFKSEEWIKLDRGTITEKQAVEKMIARCPEHRELIIKIMNEWKEILTPRRDTVQILHDLSDRGYALYVLSNFHLEAFKKVWTKYDFFDKFSGLVISAKVKSIKPEARIYRVLLDNYNIDPEKSVFIDDSKRNLAGAAKFNINTIHYQNAYRLKKELASILDNYNVNGEEVC